MVDNSEKINQLFERLEQLLKQQDLFSKEILSLRNELNELKRGGQNSAEVQTEQMNVVPSEKEDLKTHTENKTSRLSSEPVRLIEAKNISNASNPQSKVKSDLEKFIGENLINKIGIAITVIGVSIGAKYSIENNLISPVTRIVLGYLFGIALLGVGIKLKLKYENYSAVIVSGAMAIMYFMTYSAYGFYHLFPQTAAFILMLLFTGFTVGAALNYNKQIVALIGLMGSYAIPFLLSEGSGNAGLLFAYMVFLNLGILLVAFKKYWKLLYYVSFGLTWLIFLIWYWNAYDASEHFGLAFGFAFVFFLIFYTIFMAFKIIQKENFMMHDVMMMLLNSFVFYGVGYALFKGQDNISHLLGLFTVLNAFVHFVVCVLIYKKDLADRNVFYMLAGLVLIFITLAIPVQLDANWVTLLWVGEATLLYWIGIKKKVSFYERLSYPLMLLAFLSLLQDWSLYNSYQPEEPSTRLKFLLNVNFLSSILFIASFSFINKLHDETRDSWLWNTRNQIYSLFKVVLPSILIFVVYFAFRLEITAYFQQLYKDSEVIVKSVNQEFDETYKNADLLMFGSIWNMIYSMIFFSVLTQVNLKRIRNKQLGMVNLTLLLLTLLIFLSQGLYDLSELRETYLDQYLVHYYKHSIFNLCLRYIAFAFVSLVLYSLFIYSKEEYVNNKFDVAFDLVLHTTILWIASSELIHWMDVLKLEHAYKLGLSILWGIYSLFLIALGIWKKNKPIRIAAIGLFAATLIKLFLYDMSYLDNISKTIVFVSLGVLLLLISFLYNKYKHLISNEINQ